MGLAVELYKCKSNDLPYINVDTGDAQLNPLMQEIHEVHGPRRQLYHMVG